jgi:hypothetical protein
MQPKDCKLKLPELKMKHAAFRRNTHKVNDCPSLEIVFSG